MNVTYINKYYYPPHLGGVEQSLNLLARSLAKRPGVSVRAIVANEGLRGTVETIDGVEVNRVARLLAAASTPVSPGMPKAIRSAAADTDVFHLHFPYPWGEVAWLQAGAPGPCVLTYHADVVRQKRLMTLYAPVLRRVLDRVDLIIVGAPQIAKNSPFLAPVADKCRVVPFAIEEARFAEDAAATARVEVARSFIQGPIVLFVGRLVYYKGVGVLLDAMRDVDATLVVVGTGPLEAELKDRAASLGIAERVVWLPPVEDAELGAWYRAADVFCLPSVARSEAYGLVQLEAHLAGTPVVSTCLPTGVPFVNADGETGFVVEPGDAQALATALRKILSDDILRDRLGARARQRVQTEFSLSSMLDRTMAVYEEATARHSSKTRG